MADDKNKKKYTEEDNKEYLQKTAYVPSNQELKERGIPNVGKPTRPGASADSSGYFARRANAFEKMESNLLNNKKTSIPNEIEKRKESYWNEPMTTTYFQGKRGILGKVRDAQEEAMGNFFRQQDKGDKGVILNYDKDGHPISPFSSKKEIKPAAIVAPVKRPSEAVMKKVTGK